MKKNVIKTAIAAVCVVAASFTGMKAYNAANQSGTDMLLSENVEALSQIEFSVPCPWIGSRCEFGYGCRGEYYHTVWYGRQN